MIPKIKMPIWSLLLLCGMMLMIAPTTAQQSQSTVDVRLSELGAYIPADVDFFLAVRTGSSYLDSLDTITLSLTEQVPEDILPTQSFRDLLDQIIVPEIDNISIVNFLDFWVGDESAIGINNLEVLLDDNPDNDTEAVIYLAVRITQRAFARGAIATIGLTTDSIRTEQDDFTLFTNEANPNSVALNNDLLLITFNDSTSALNLPSIAEQSDFQAVLPELPTQEQEHLGILYAEATETVQVLAQDRAVRDILSALSLDADALGGIAVGIGLAENLSIVADVVQLRTLANPPVNQPIDLAFAAHLPADTAFVLHTTDLTTLTNSASGLIAAISASDTPDGIYERLEVLSELLLGLDLQTQVLDVAAGDYAILVDVDETTTPPLGDVGAIFELGLVEGADALSTGIGAGATQLFETATISPITLDVADTALPALSINIPNSPPTEIIVTHQQERFYFATRPLITQLVTASPTLQDNVNYQQAVQHMLPDAHISLFVNQQGPAALVDFSVVLLGSLGTIVTENTLQLEDIATLRNILDLILTSGSVSTLTNENGHLLMRFVVTLAA